ncbi:DNA polymerase IV [Ilyomonas limi]|uniref:DNA polymerase IV n=1 Tax=Ilyomonas limi TaxID=2575867 RepID=A0A4U3KR84_9BACT|nr:DNA polymerase IV [Ilyomonas limi]TKK64848.1 DNA polymerase IV [Ilyomonas limi]
MLLSAARHITHMDLDTFFVSVECLRNPKLKGKPVLIGGMSDRGVVASCSYEARKFGIHSGMPMKVAQRLCSHAYTVKSDYEAYSSYSRLVTDVISDTVPLFEKASIDEFYIDLTGMDKFFGCLQFSDELKRRIIRESGLSISYGLASNKLVSKVATNEIKPNGQIEIPFGNEKTFLSPLSIMKIPGVGKEVGYKLLKMGVETVKILSEIPVNMLYNLLGKPGIELHRKANGIDEMPVIPYREQKSISTEETFSTDTIDLKFIHQELIRMTEKIAFELRLQRRLTGCVAVKIRYSDFQTEQKQMTIDYTAFDNVLIQKVKELFTSLYTKRQLVRLVGVRFTDLIGGTHQIDMFNDSQESLKLHQAMDSIKSQYGEKYLMRASGNSATNNRKPMA